jgi:N-acyl-L-homoserine lactone synthetase
MLHAVSSANAIHYRSELTEMFQLRHRVFAERMGWNVSSQDGAERDQFDELDPVYLIYLGDDGHVEGSLRLLPTTGPYMLSEVFPQLLDGMEVPHSPAIWESSRFSVDARQTEGHGLYALNKITSMLLCGITEFGLANGIRELVSVYDVRIERILKRANVWHMGHRFGRPSRIGDTRAITGIFEVSERTLTALRTVFGLSGSAFAISPDHLTKRAA